MSGGHPEEMQVAPCRVEDREGICRKLSEAVRKQHAASGSPGSSTTYSALGVCANECSRFSLMTAIGSPLQS